jgi:putative restriction endonuclease
MKGYVANTDLDWFTYLRDQAPWEEVNFWQPSGSSAFHAVPPGAPVLFRLKSPHNRIGGFGWFLRHVRSDPWQAWDAFGTANGAPDRDTMFNRIARYRKSGQADTAPIGCLMLAEPVFFPAGAFIQDPADWKPNIVRGKGYDLTSGEGARIWAQCRERAGLMSGVAPPDAPDRFGSVVLTSRRLGQGSFRMAVTAAYEGACAITTEHSLPVLDAAHIKPYGEGGEHLTTNGLLLRADLHRLFDRGYVTVTPEHVLRVSRALRDDYSNGAAYYPLDGLTIRAPADSSDRPDPRLLEWHGDEVFRG